MMTILPIDFENKMKSLLGDEYESFLASYDRERVQGLRVNLLKTGANEFLKDSPFALEPIPWCPEGFYYRREDRPGRHPLHEAGVYYIQEPSAMAVVELLDPRPGDKVLDLCAAPGGKTTHIASRLGGEGFLLSNEIHPQRARILSQNVERIGIANAVVSNEEPAGLSPRFPEFFDKIVVDAPCSGEGMFRKDQTAREEWSPDHVKLCAARQQEILEHAALMLRGGGRLVYSTCTFSPEENEGTISRFLDSHPEFSIEPVPAMEQFGHGRPEWADGRSELTRTVRIWPHLTEGEGHFMAVLKKEEGLGEQRREYPRYVKDKKLLKDFYSFCVEQLSGQEGLTERKEYVLFGDQLYLLPPEMTDFSGLKILRPGLHMGTFKKNRFEPSHALSHWLKEGCAARVCRLDSGGAEVMDYLTGQALRPSEGSVSGSGWVLVTVQGYGLGWGKLAGGVLKNHYPKGLRIAL